MALQMFACTATQMCVMKVPGYVSGGAGDYQSIPRLEQTSCTLRVVLGPFFSTNPGRPSAFPRRDLHLHTPPIRG